MLSGVGVRLPPSAPNLWRPCIYRAFAICVTIKIFCAVTLVVLIGLAVSTFIMPEKKLFPTRTYHVYAPRDLKKRWFVYYYEGEKRIRITKGINTNKTARQRMKAAEDLIKELKRLHKKAKPLSDTAEALKRYLEDSKPQWRRSTYEEYIGMNNAFLRFLKGREVTEALVHRYMLNIRAKYQPATWNKHRDRLKNNLRAIGCPDWFEAFPPMKFSSSPSRYFQKHQVQLLGETIRDNNDDLWLFVQFMFYTFIRPKELRGLKVGDVLLDEGEIRVPAAISKNKKTQFVAIPDIFMSKLDFLKDLPPGHFIFPGRDDGKALSKNTMYRRHRKILEHLEFGSEYSLYSWKHTGAITLFRKGVSIKEIQMQMRHHSLDQTDQYLRQLGARDVVHLRKVFPSII